MFLLRTRKFYKYCVLLVLITLCNALCNENIYDLEQIIDISYPKETLDYAHHNTITAFVALIELNYYILTNNYYNISDEYILTTINPSLECSENIICVTDNIKNINLVSTNDSATIYNYYLYSLNHATPIGIKNINTNTISNVTEISDYLYYGGII